MNPMFDRKDKGPVEGNSAGLCAVSAWQCARQAIRVSTALAAWILIQFASSPAAIAQQTLSDGQSQSSLPRVTQARKVPPRVIEAQRFLAQRGWAPGHPLPLRANVLRGRDAKASGAPTNLTQAQPAAGVASSATWQSLGPAAVLTPDFGLVTGRIAALALDPSDATGNRLYVGTTGGGVWMANNAAVSATSSIVFAPLTDNVAALGGAVDASISIGALTVQPGETGVILAGTGDPNDILDSYYGAGILRSTDGGNTWSLIQMTADKEDGLSSEDSDFAGNGFAGFAWSTLNPQVVVAAVSQAYESQDVDANVVNASYAGLYYSSDSGATWHMATITDGSGYDVQGPLDMVPSPHGNAATAVVWNPVRQLFIAAVRFHGYYQSPDGVTWTRMAAQPGPGLTAQMCPSNIGSTGSIACPIYRGALAVNPETGDTFAWTVDLNNQDQGLWQDPCAVSGGSCTNPAVTFAKQWSTSALQTSTLEGPVTILDGDYNLALAAVPSQQDTLVLAGANDLWKCSLAMGCVWRNTTNSTTCMSAQVGEFQHALAWSAANPLEILLGNDSGLWRSMDAIAETGAACSATDATHFQNLNGSLGSLAEVVSMSPVFMSPYSLMAGLGVNGTAGVKSAAATAVWPQILAGYGGPVAVDPTDSSNWYVNNESGVSIYLCAQTAPCTPAAFGQRPVVTDADVGGDGDAMPVPAPFLVDPLDPSQLLIGTCRVWRGPANNSSGWSAANAISPILDSGATGTSCNGDALIRSMAAAPLTSGGEIVYLGMYGSANNGANLPGHILSAIVNPSSSATPTWTDLTLNPVLNDAHTLNYYDLDVSSVTIDPHAPNTVYVTVEGMENPQQEIQVVYRSTNGGATWTDITANLPSAPANSLAVDPQNANTVYVATDQGVYFTTEVANCTQILSNCWSAFGAGLPAAPAVGLSAASAGASTPVLVAATYGRGIWQTALWSAGTALTTAAASPASFAFPSQVFDTASSPQTVTLENTGNLTLAPTSIAMSGSFSETDNCVNAAIEVGASCAVQITFTPQATGPQSGEMTIFANVYGGQLTVDLTGTGTAAGQVSLTPSTVSFGEVEVGTTSAALQVTAANSGASAIPLSNVSITPPFELGSNACGASSLPANTDCQVQVEFAPTQPGPAAGLLTFTDGAGTQTVELSGTGAAAPTDVLNPTSLAFQSTPEGQLSAVQSVTITNTGGLPLTSISISASTQFVETSNCVTQLAAGAVCTISVKFAPAQVGAVTGALSISDALRTQTVALSGIGLAPPAFSVNPTSLIFTNQQPGVPSASQTLTITNSGGAPLANVGFEITGVAAANYSIAATTCGALLSNGNSCTVQIVFTPGATGAIAATLAISSSTSDVTAISVPLNGLGQLASGLATNPSQLTFPVVAAGQSSTAQAVTVTNSSNFAISAVTLAAGAPFSVTQNTCTGSLAAGANCTAAVIFQPNAGGSASGALTVNSASVAAPATVALSGTGFDFAVSVSGPASQTVARGQQANYTLVISPSGSSGAFTFTCGTLPSNATCLFNPTTESLSAGVQGNVEVEISTSNGSQARQERPVFWHSLPLACGLILLPFAIRRRRRMFLLVLLAVILALSVTSCTSSGGGTGGQTGGSGTPTGTYTFPVNVVSTGMTQSVSLTLTVD
jgi:hypothetical protein